MALSYHVDYWDYLGWKDTLGSAAASQRQYDYAHARGDMNVYTPQMIVDGRGHIVGSNRPAVLEAIRRAQSRPEGISLAMNYEGREMVIEIGSSDSAPEATVWLMPVIPQVSVKILKGEIAGREMIYYNVVRTPMPAGMWNGKAKTLSLPKDVVLGSGAKGCVALLQEGKTGPILGSAGWGDIAA